MIRDRSDSRGRRTWLEDSQTGRPGQGYGIDQNNQMCGQNSIYCKSGRGGPPTPRVEAPEQEVKKEEQVRMSTVMA